MAKNFIEEYFIGLKLDTKDAEKGLSILNKYEKQLEKIMKMQDKKSISSISSNSKNVENEIASYNKASKQMDDYRQKSQATNKSVFKDKLKEQQLSENLRKKELALMKKFYKAQEKRASKAQNLTENLKAQVHYSKLNNSQQAALNKKLKQAGDILRRTGNADLFGEARRDMAHMVRQSKSLQNNLKQASRIRMQAAQDFKSGLQSTAIAGGVVGGAATLVARDLDRIAKERAAIESSFQVAFNGDTTKSQETLERFERFAKNTGLNVERSVNALGKTFASLSMVEGVEKAEQQTKELQRLFAAFNVGTAQQDALQLQYLQSAGDDNARVMSEELNSIIDAVPALIKQLEKQTGKTVKQLKADKQGLLFKDLKSAISSLSKSTQVSAGILKRKNSILGKSAEAENALYDAKRRMLNAGVYDSLISLYGSLAKAMEKNPQLFVQLGNGLGVAIEGVAGFTDGISKTLTYLEQFGIGLKEILMVAGGVYAAKKGIDIYRYLKQIRSMNVRAGIVNVTGSSGGMGGDLGGNKKKTNKTNKPSKFDGLKNTLKYVKNSAPTLALAAGSRALPVAGMVAGVGIAANHTNINKDAILEAARGGELGGRVATMLKRADEANKQFEVSKVGKEAINNNTTNNTTNHVTQEIALNVTGVTGDDVVYKIQRHLAEFTGNGGGR